MTFRLLSTLLAFLPLSVGCSWVGSYLSARALDLADCVKGNVGAGIGLTVDAHVTDYIAPGIGILSYTANVGYEDRAINGVWLESIVINTPRFAYETVFQAYEESEQTPDENLEGSVIISQLALRSLLLPNERWIRKDDDLTVDYYTLLNIAGLGQRNRAAALTGLLRRSGEIPRTREKTGWQAGFVEIGATLGFVEARVGFNPLELVDFLAGIFGWDPADDDPRSSVGVPLPPAAVGR